MSYYTGVIHDGTDLTTLPNTFIHNVITDNSIEVSHYTDKLARVDGVRNFGKSYGAKKITIEGHIGANSRAGFISARGTLLKYLEHSGVELLVPVFNLPIIYTGVFLEKASFSNTGGGYGEFEIILVASDPFGYDRDLRTLINGSTVTSTPQSVSFLEPVGGDYKTPLIIRVTVSSVTGGTGKYISLINSDGDSITVTRNWVSDDQLIISAEDKSCKVNGVDVDYTGNFWDAGVGDTGLTYADNFTTRSVNILSTYARRYL